MDNSKENISSLATAIEQGERKDLARAITMVENHLPGSDSLLKQLQIKEIPVIGITGPPGAGKSTLINAFLRYISEKNKKVAVLAVDPTSPFNYGSLLADRIRMSEHFNNKNIFIRSIATRGSLGGLSEKIIEITDILKASDFDYIIVETVGVGQSEVEIAGLADTTIVLMVPESGDDIQTMKSGIMEIADIFVVNKADREGSSLLENNLKKMLSQRENKGWIVPVVKTIAISGMGIEELFNNITMHRSSKGFNEKKIYLLTEKVYQLARNHRMKGLLREYIKQELEKAIREPSFNLYKFADQFIK